MNRQHRRIFSQQLLSRTAGRLWHLRRTICCAEFPGISGGHLHRCPRQYFAHFAAQPPATMLQETSPDCGETQKAAVRLPPAPPSDRQVIAGPRTRIWPSRDRPVGFPINCTSASRASTGSASTHGWPALQVPSISLAATPDRRTRGPSAHQIGPSPSQTRTGVHWNICPAGTTATAARSANSISILTSCKWARRISSPRTISSLPQIRAAKVAFSSLHP